VSVFYITFSLFAFCSICCSLTEILFYEVLILKINYCNYTVRHKNQNVIDCHLKMYYQILIIFGTNIADTTGYQMVIYIFASPNVCFCTTWGKQNEQNITFLFNAVSLFDSNKTHSAHFVQIFSTLVDSLSNCPVVQLLTVNIQNICHLHKHKQGDAFSTR